MNKASAIGQLLAVMARLRSPNGCPWDREQNHRTLRFHAVEEVYELMDAIEAGDDHEMVEELGDLLLQVVFHCQLARERGAFDFDQVCRRIVNKLVHRHPHVFGDKKLHTAGAVLAQWERLKRAEKEGTRHARPSALDGIPKHLPALLRAEKLLKKARKAGLMNGPGGMPSTASPMLPVLASAIESKARGSRRSQGRGGTRPSLKKWSQAAVARGLFALAEQAQRRGWSAEELLRAEVGRLEKTLRRRERK